MAKLMAPNIRIDWYPEDHFADVENPTVSELNSGYNLSCAVVTGFTLDFSESNTEDTTSILDDFESQIIISHSYEASLQFFLAERGMTEEDSENVKAYKTAERLFHNMKNPKGFLGKRFGYRGTTSYEDTHAVTLFSVQADLPKVVSEDDAPIMLEVLFHPTGLANIYVPKIAYEWEGEPHKSTAVKKLGNKILARNEVINGSFEESLSNGWAPLSTTNVTRTSAYQNQMWSPRYNGPGPVQGKGRYGEDIVQVSTDEDLDNDHFYILQHGSAYIDIEEDEWIGINGLIANDTGFESKISVQFYNSDRDSLSEPAGMDQYADGKFYVGRKVHFAVQAPKGSDYCRIVIWCRSKTRDDVAKGKRLWADGIIAVKTDNEREAFEQSQEYFDGDKPDENIT